MVWGGGVGHYLSSTSICSAIVSLNLHMIMLGGKKIKVEYVFRILFGNVNVEKYVY